MIYAGYSGSQEPSTSLSRFSRKYDSRATLCESTTIMIDLVKRPVLTDKAIRLLENNQYTFEVDASLTKPRIKQMIEELFDVKVVSVNTHRPPRKKKRLGAMQGYQHRGKRAIITLRAGDSIALLPET
uniref:Large ribosomal subunit protein uL23c n=1 Tax=Nephroselmis pyriformis TaxID=156128 RepID=A0A8A2H8K1_9CHLO|nr:ribosomal protein L23 [Nephroselmis pyriformis]QSV37280.1 ribosomal protein L23 [Nephroselmis pyriformis]